MAFGTDRRAFLPGGLKAERIELVGNTVLIHTQAEAQSAQDAARFLGVFIATIGVVSRICQHTGGKSGSL